MAVKNPAVVRMSLLDPRPTTSYHCLCCRCKLCVPTTHVQCNTTHRNHVCPRDTLSPASLKALVMTFSPEKSSSSWMSWAVVFYMYSENIYIYIYVCSMFIPHTHKTYRCFGKLLCTMVSLTFLPPAARCSQPGAASGYTIPPHTFA